MKISNINNPQRFFDVVQHCEGRVELVTDEGDRLNLKSKLCQYIMLTQMFKDATIANVEILLSEPSDIDLLMDFLVRG